MESYIAPAPELFKPFARGKTRGESAEQRAGPESVEAASARIQTSAAGFLVRPEGRPRARAKLQSRLSPGFRGRRGRDQ